jgi:ADP-heptose:LPS heptosyltransferase
VGVIRLRSLGDCVLTTPALDILKRCRPDLRVAVVVEDRFRALFENNPDIDEILPPRLAALRRFRPALCLNLHGGTRSVWLTALSGARFRAGFGHFRHQFAYNFHIPRAQQILGVERKVHTAEHLASAVFFLGAPAGDIPRAKLVARAPAPAKPAPNRPAVIHPVAATAEKTWRPEGFLAVAAHLRDSGLEPVFIGGADDDLSPFRAYRTLSGASLNEIKSLLSGASLFVGNDSGPAHMAAAFGVPVVVIFGASDPAIWGPWRTACQIVAAPGSQGIQSIETARVLEALARLRVAA